MSERPQHFIVRRMGGITEGTWHHRPTAERRAGEIGGTVVNGPCYCSADLRAAALRDEQGTDEPRAPRLYTDAGETWHSMIAAIDRGERIEVSEALWDYWLDVLPPVRFAQTMTVQGERRRVAFGAAEGTERIRAFWKEGNRMFCQLSDEVNHG